MSDQPVIVYPELLDDPEMTPQLVVIEKALHDALDDYSFDTVRMAAYVIAVIQQSEPAEAEIEAAAKTLWSQNQARFLWEDLKVKHPGIARDKCAAARAALIAARTASA